MSIWPVQKSWAPSPVPGPSTLMATSGYRALNSSATPALIGSTVEEPEMSTLPVRAARRWSPGVVVRLLVVVAASSSPQAAATSASASSRAMRPSLRVMFVFPPDWVGGRPAGVPRPSPRHGTEGQVTAPGRAGERKVNLLGGRSGRRAGGLPIVTSARGRRPHRRSSRPESCSSPPSSSWRGVPRRLSRGLEAAGARLGLAAGRRPGGSPTAVAAGPGPARGRCRRAAAGIGSACRRRSTPPASGCWSPIPTGRWSWPTGPPCPT